uniref:Deoxyhypusine synthase n=1 Tax=Leersia perrieri TaxID=77586 RepID=A0A0D9XDT9_9ORYZ
MAGEGGDGGGGSGGGARDVDALEGVRSIVLKPSESLDEGRLTRIAGADFNDAGLGLSGLLASLASTGFQASNLGDAIDVVNQMLEWRLSHEKPREDCDEAELDPTYRESVKCKIFLGFTSNLVSSGIRDVVRFLVQHHMVDVIVTTAGGIEEDLIKCLAPTYRGDFSLPGTLLRSKGLNRIGNLLVPNDNYCKFENWIMPFFDQMLQEQSTENVWTPSKVIARLGKEINDESSYLYWAYRINEWGSHSCNPKEDRDHRSWWSDSGAQPDEAVSWGKIKGSAKPVKVHCDATIAFPLLVAATFTRKLHGAKQTY